MEKSEFVTLLVAMRNEEAYIDKCISSLVTQDYPHENYEVIILDGCSTDNSLRIVEEYLPQYPFLKLVNNPRIIQAAAWNMGIEQSQGSVIGIVSAHSILATDYVSNLVETIRRTGADMVGGPTVASSTGLIAEAIALALNSPFGVGNAKFHYTTKEIEVDTVFMGACYRQVYEKIGGFDEDMVRNQDDEFSYRLRESGGRIICNPNIRSSYFNRSNLPGLWRQYFQYGFYKVRVLQKHPHQMSMRQFVPPAFVLSLIASLILYVILPWGWILLAVIAGSYLAANLTASLITASRKGWKHLWLLPVTFAILHLSYGLGFLSGLVKFWNRWGDKTGKVSHF